MGFSSLADELGDGFGGGEEMRRGPSLADEFGLDEGLEDEMAGDGSLDEIDFALDASPEPLDPLTPHLAPSTPPTPTSRLRTSKITSPSVYYTADEMDGDFSFDTSINLDRPSAPSTPASHLSTYPARSPQPPSTTSRYTPSIQRDPLVELEECISSTSRLIGGVKALHPPPSLAGLSSSTTITSLSSRSISSCGSQTTIRALGGGEGQEGDVVDRLAAYAAGVAGREKRLDGRISELEEMMGRWEEVGYGAGLELDLSVVLRDGVGVGGAEVAEGLPTTRRSGLIPSLDYTLPSPSHPSPNPFSQDSAVHLPFLHPSSPTTSPSVSSLIADLHPDSVLPALLSLRETLHTHSSHTMSAQRQVRQIKGAIQGSKERDEAEETARTGIEGWEGRRVADGLKGLGGARERLGREMRGFEDVLGRFEREMEVRMGNVRAVRAG